MPLALLPLALFSFALSAPRQEGRGGEVEHPVQEDPASRKPRALHVISIEARDGVPLSADLYLAHPDPRTPFVVLFHQARSSRGEYRQIAPRLNDLGYNCLAVDLRSGQACADIKNMSVKAARSRGREPTYLDALPDMEDALVWARAQHAKGKLVGWGSSYSAALVLHLAGTKPELLDGAIAFAPGEYFGSLGMGPTWIRDSAGGIRCPAFLTSARSEQADWRPILEAIPGSARTGFIPESEGAHGSKALWERTEGHEEYWQAVESFLREHFPPGQSGQGSGEERRSTGGGDQR